MQAELIADMPALPPAEEKNNLYNWDDLAEMIQSLGLIIAGRLDTENLRVAIAIMRRNEKDKPAHVSILDTHAADEQLARFGGRRCGS